jgi:hypothetical protein
MQSLELKVPPVVLAKFGPAFSQYMAAVRRWI